MVCTRALDCSLPTAALGVLDVYPAWRKKSLCLFFVGTKQPQVDGPLNIALVFHQSDDKLKKETSRDEEDNEDEGSTPKAEEYDPMEAEDADDDDDDDGRMPSLSINAASPGQ